MNEKRRSYARNTSCDSTNANHCGLLCLPNGTAHGGSARSIFVTDGVRNA